VEGLIDLLVWGWLHSAPFHLLLLLIETVVNVETVVVFHLQIFSGVLVNMELAIFYRLVRPINVVPLVYVALVFVTHKI
jgi:hypothetical protein